MKRALLIVGAFFLLSATANAAISTFDGHWYEVVTQDNDLTWKAAQANANEMGGYLASINSVEENTLLANLLSGQSQSHINYWLGGYQTDTNGKADEGWAWDSGEDWVDFNLWEKNEPNNGNGIGQDYLHFWPTKGKWDDMHNGSNMVGYVVEFTDNPVPVPPALVLLGCGLLGFAGVRRRIK